MVLASRIVPLNTMRIAVESGNMRLWITHRLRGELGRL